MFLGTKVVFFETWIYITFWSHKDPSGVTLSIFSRKLYNTTQAWNRTRPKVVISCNLGQFLRIKDLWRSRLKVFFSHLAPSVIRKDRKEVILGIHVLNLGVSTWANLMYTLWLWSHGILWDYWTWDVSMRFFQKHGNKYFSGNQSFFSQSRKRIFHLPFRCLSQDHLFFGGVLCLAVGTKWKDFSMSQRGQPLMFHGALWREPESRFMKKIQPDSAL